MYTSAGPCFPRERYANLVESGSFGFIKDHALLGCFRLLYENLSQEYGGGKPSPIQWEGWSNLPPGHESINSIERTQQLVCLYSANKQEIDADIRHALWLAGDALVGNTTPRDLAETLLFLTAYAQGLFNVTTSPIRVH